MKRLKHPATERVQYIPVFIICSGRQVVNTHTSQRQKLQKLNRLKVMVYLIYLIHMASYVTALTETNGKTEYLMTLGIYSTYRLQIMFLMFSLSKKKVAKSLNNILDMCCGSLFSRHT